MSTTSRAWRGGRADWRLHALSAFSLAVAFVCLASTLLVVVNLDAVQQRWARAGRASVFLRDGATETMVAELRHALEKTPGVRSVRYISPSDARQEVVGDAPESTLAALPPEAFPASLEVEVASEVADVDMTAMTEKLKQVPSVESVETYQRYTDKLRELLRAAVAASAVLAAVVFAAVVSVVGSTVRLSLQRRQIEVEVLRLVGATERYVRMPFVLEGCVQGAAGAASAVALLACLYLMVRTHVQEMAIMVLGVPPTFLPWYVVLGLISAGALLGAVSSHLSLKRMATV